MTKTEIPESYVKAVAAMARVLRSAVLEGKKPLYFMPPKDLWVILPLDDALTVRFCANSSARDLLVPLSIAASGDATLMMLCAALEHEGIETLPLGAENLALLASYTRAS